MNGIIRKIRKRIFWKGFTKVFFIEVTAHIIVCTILSFYDYRQAIVIFLVGLILPDIYTLYIYVFKPKGTIPKVKRYIEAIHGINLLIALIAILSGYPLIGIAGISHSILDNFGL